ncbi:MAG: diacylglycerol kinase family protein [Candidatus Pacebacteria bacterium]|jgi:diacylglycerol kinase|nr:diacylglycerol kinase family protein [Candidatus Paceibacterota bacterium]
MEKLSEKKRFSLVARIQSTNNALRGVGIFIRATHNAWMHFFFGFLALFLGFLLEVSTFEWLIIIIAIAMVIITEAINTAIEIDIDLTSPNYHPYARDTKDVAAGAALLAVAMSGIIGLIIFLPKIIPLIVR